MNTTLHADHFVTKITELPWESLSVTQAECLMLVMAHTATEFAESLRASIIAYPELHVLQEVAEEELHTENLQFKGYNSRADHPDFLWHFIHEAGIHHKYSVTNEAGNTYRALVRAFPTEVKLQSIISRENSGVGIFTRLLASSNTWEGEALSAFEYYLRRHIELDSGDDGHGSQLASIEDKNIQVLLAPFYQELYMFFVKVWEEA